MKINLKLLLVVPFLCGTSLYAQYSTKNKKAIEYYNQGVTAARKNPQSAVEFFQKAYDKDNKFVEAAWKLSGVYAELLDEKNQVNCLLPTVENPKHPKYEQCVLALAKAYFETGQYDQASKYYNMFPQKANASIRRCEVAQKLMANPIPFDPHNMGSMINTEYDDYWPNISADGTAFSTTVLVGKLQGQRQSYTDQEDIYRSEKLKDGTWAKSAPLGAPIQTKKNEGSQSFSLDGKYMFFVACDRKNSLGGCDIYYSIREGNGWGEPINPGEPLNSKYWESTPSFSSEGNEIFFASNRKGGIGGQDIWKCDVSENADGTLSFSNATNMGENINTMRDERSPFIHPDNQTLYFSSEGWPGMGKFDVFFTRKDAYGTWSLAENLGYPLNTHRDEIGFVVNSKGDKAYFSSNGLEQNGMGREIYEADLDERLRPQKVDFFIGRVVDDETMAPLEADIKLYNTKDESVVSHSKSEKYNGRCILRVPASGDEYAYSVTSSGYMPLNEKIEETNTGEEHLIRLKKAAAGSNIVLKNVFFDTNSFELKEESKFELNQIVKFMNENPAIRVRFEGHTDSQGSRELNTKLSDNRAQSVKAYMIQQGIDASRMEAQGFGPDRPVASNDDEEGRAQNRRTEMVVLQ